MPTEDGDWQVVRRSRRLAAKDAYQQLVASNKLNIPVVALGYSALREEDPDEVKQREKRKAAKKRAKENKKARAASAAEASDEQEPEEPDDEPTTARQQAATTSKPRAGPATAAATSARGATAVTQPAQPNWMFRLVFALLAWLSALFGLGGSGKKKKKAKPPAVKAATAQPAAAMASRGGTSTVSASEAPSSRAAPAVSVKEEPKPKQERQQQQQRVQPQPSTPSVPPAPAPMAQPPPKADAPKANTPAAPAPPSAASAAKAVAVSAAAAVPLPATPATKCDKEWVRGKFFVSSVPHAHADVVSSVALAGQLALSAGYDGALKLWRLKPNTQPAHLKNLVGHSGRVEAVCADTRTARAVSTGRDSSLKLWQLSSDAADVKELSSTYVYESVRSMVVRWSDGVAALGSRSGNISLYELATGRKLGVLKGHGDEVTALAWAEDGAGLLWSGAADGCVMAWSVRAPGAAGGIGAEVASFQAVRGKVSSLAVSSAALYVGDSSTTVKVFDLQAVQDGAADRHTATRLPNAPVFAGDACPTMVATVAAPGNVMLSSGVAWWTDDLKVLAEAGPEAQQPAGLVNVHAVDTLDHEYMYSMRVGPGVVTCMAGHGDQVLLGNTNGTLTRLSLARGPLNKLSVGVQGESGVWLQEPLPVGCEEHSEDEADSDSDEDE